MRALPLALLAWVVGQAVPPVQDSAKPASQVLENTGRPMRVPFACTDDDIHIAGLTCSSRQPCAVYLELADVEAVGNRIFATGNLHTEAATLFSILLASDDGGKTWSEPHERIRGAGLDQVQFFDLETGWISGQTLGGTPRDPFLLLTRDGGKTWSVRPVSAEARAGMIDSFKFDSQTHGWLWVDREHAADEGNRWEAYETGTGGESWALREATSRSPHAARAPAPAASWRARADAATKSFRIETRAGGRWMPVAGFLIRAGECRESEPAMDQPQ